MTPGEMGQAMMVQLGLAHNCKSDKETVFLTQVWKLGLTFQTLLQTTPVKYPSGISEHPYLPMTEFSQEILLHFPEQLLAGYTFQSLASFEEKLETFWERFKWTWPTHPVYNDHKHELKRCIPCRLHCDEGTGVRRTGIMQISWGPILKRGLASAWHCFFYSCIHSDVYKAFNQGYKDGNQTLDDIMECFVGEALQAYWDGIPCPGGHSKIFLVFIRQEGDLPAQAKIWHLQRTFVHFPNPMCSWCLADGDAIDFSDFRRTAMWRATAYTEKPWGSTSPMNNLPGGENEMILAKDLFHLSNLGITRTFVSSLICYLVSLKFFSGGGNSVPARLNMAYQSFREWCKLHCETPDIKHFSTDGFKWKPTKFPESSMFLGLVVQKLLIPCCL